MLATRSLSLVRLSGALQAPWPGLNYQLSIIRRLQTPSQESVGTNAQAGYDHGLRKLIVFFPCDVVPVGRPTDSVLPTENSVRTFKRCFALLVLEGQHWHAAIDIFWRTHEHLFFPRRLLVHLIMRRDGADTKQARAVRLSETCSPWSALIRQNSMFGDTMKALISYAWAFDLKNRVKIFNAGIKDVFDDTSPSEHLPNRTQATYMQYIWLVKLYMIDHSVLFLAMHLGTEGGTGKVLGKLDLECPVLNSSELEYWVLMEGPGEYFHKNYTQSTTLSVSSNCFARIIPWKAAKSVDKTFYWGPSLFVVLHVSEVAGPTWLPQNGQTVVFPQHALIRFRP